MGRVVGIDLGTTNSLVAAVGADGQAAVITNADGQALVPSVIAFEAGTEMIVGSRAKKQIVKNPERTVYSVKRLMGRSFADITDDAGFLGYQLVDRRDGLVRVNIDGTEYTPIELSAFILRELKQHAENLFGEAVTQAVITVPAYFNDSQRQATKDAGRIAGLEVLRIINEPTAAALSYGLQKKEKGNVAVYDLGGGTFDISILKLSDGIFEVLATNGNTHLGGDDIDRAIMLHFMEIMTRDHDVDFDGNANLKQAVRQAAENAKIALSNEDSTTAEISLSENGPYVRVELDRETLEKLSKTVVDKTLHCCKKAMHDAGLLVDDLDHVVLVGGSTRQPLVQQVVERYFGQAPETDINPDEVVALGAAVQAGILTGETEQEALLLDVTPLSLGIETMGGVMSVLIGRNSPIPTKQSERFTTWVDGQTNVAINVYQGERDLVKDNRSLAKFDLKGIPPMSAGLAKILVTFLIDENGILHVSAKDERSGKKHAIEVKPTYGLTDEEVESMLMASFEHAEEDIATRMLVEARNEGQLLIQATEKALSATESGLDAGEIERIRAVAEDLRTIMEGTDFHLIREKTDALNAATQSLAEQLMDGAVQTALKSKTIGEAIRDHT